MLLRCLLPLALLPGRRRQRRLYPHRPDADPAELSGGCAERAHCDVLAGSARQSRGSLRSLLAGIDGDGRVQMAMNGGIYDKAYAPLGLYIEDGKRLTPVNRSAGGGNFFIRPGGVFWWKTAGRKSCRCRRTNPLPPSAMRCSPARC